MPSKKKKIITRELREDEQHAYDKLIKVINNNSKSYAFVNYMVQLVDELVDSILKNDGQILEEKNGR